MRITRTRRNTAPVGTEFEINFKITVSEPGVTKEEMAAHVQECMRYATAAFAFEINHPIIKRGKQSRHVATGKVLSTLLK